VLRFRDFPDNPMGIPEKELDRIAHIALPLGESTLMATDPLESWGPATSGTNFYINVETDSVEETERLFNALADGGTIEMDLQKTECAEKYGTCTDRYGVQWMVLYSDQ
jgi:PhnB protein